jgi:hypothetical protein
MTTKMNWGAAAARDRIARRGGETANGQAIGHPRPGRKTNRQMPARKAKLEEPIKIATRWKNRSGEEIHIRLTPFEGFDLVDMRVWRADQAGISRPGKGLALQVKHLPWLAAALARALTRARELGLINDDDAHSNGDQP